MGLCKTFLSSQFLVEKLIFKTKSAPSGPIVAPIFLWLAERTFPRDVDLFTLNAEKIRKPFSFFIYIDNKGLGFFTLVSSAAQGRRKKDTEEEERRT